MARFCQSVIYFARFQCFMCMKSFKELISPRTGTFLRSDSVDIISLVPVLFLFVTFSLSEYLKKKNLVIKCVVLLLGDVKNSRSVTFTLRMVQESVTSQSPVVNHEPLLIGTSNMWYSCRQKTSICRYRVLFTNRNFTVHVNQSKVTQMSTFSYVYFC